jgi:hypothetical protein
MSAATSSAAPTDCGHASFRGLPAEAEYGLVSIFYYVFAAVFFLIPVSLVAAELATGWPQKGGVFRWVGEAFGPRWGFVAIFLQWAESTIWFLHHHLGKDRRHMVCLQHTFLGHRIDPAFGVRCRSPVRRSGSGRSRLAGCGRSPLTKATLSAIQDLSPREVALFAPRVVITLWMGIYPSSFSGFWGATVAAMITHHQVAMHAPITLTAVIR